MDLSNKFQTFDYIVFSLVLLTSVAIGLFYGCYKSRQNNTKEYLLAGKTMGAFPTAMSLTASFMSGIIILGTPVEMYTYGTMYWDLLGGYLFAMFSAAYFYMPVFLNLELTSVYEYLELRFSKVVRILISFLATLQTCIYMSIVVYAPSLALSQVTGINTYVAVTIMFCICIFYTVLGGMRAVMWTDTLQVSIMIFAMVLIVSKGLIDAGGPTIVWNTASNGSRIEFFNFSFDPRERHTVWGLVIGGYFQWIALYGVNQAQVQRYLSASSKKEARKAIWINLVNLSVLLSICCFAGLLVYNKYRLCDPLRAGRIKQSDQLFSLYVMETVGNMPGVPGLFVAAVFSGALSTVSSGINAIAATSLEDFAKAIYPRMKDERATIISKLLAISFGILSYGLVFVAAQLGGVLQAANTIFGIIGGPVLGVFTLGLCFPWTSTKGALMGTVLSMSFLAALGASSNVATYRGVLVTPKLPVSTAGCPAVNQTLSSITPHVGESGGLLELCRVSYIWYSTIGFFLTLVIGALFSAPPSNRNTKKINPKLIHPCAQRIFRMKTEPPVINYENDDTDIGHCLSLQDLRYTNEQLI